MSNQHNHQKNHEKTSMVPTLISPDRVGRLCHHQHEGISDGALSDGHNLARSARIVNIVHDSQNDISVELVQGLPKLQGHIISCSYDEFRQ